jgi:endonuclease YncB( thermonuclease family)
MSDRERLRDLIRAELAKHRPRENAHASLELLAETAIVIEPAPNSEGAAQAGNESWSEDAVRRAVEELRRSYPQLFREATDERLEAADEVPAAAPDNPRDEAPASSATPARDWLFLEPRSGTSGRRADAGLGPLASAAGALRPRSASCGGRVKKLGSLFARPRTLRDSAADDGSAPRSIAVRPEGPTPPSRYVYAALAFILALSAFAWLWPASTPKLGPGETTLAKRHGAPSEAGRSNETSSLSGQPANGKRTWPVADEPPGTLRGVPEVIDTATIRVEGKVVRLFGVDWARGGQAEDLVGYLRGREVECELASAPDRYRCQIGGHDLSRAVLFNGGGRATADASPELVAAENHAKAAGRGVWQK